MHPEVGARALMHASIPTVIAAQVLRAQALLGQQLAENLKAIHLFGSALDGELRPHSAATGSIAPKHVAAEWALGRLPQEHRGVLEVARSAYLWGTGDDLAARREQTTAFVRYARGAIARQLSS